MVLPLVPQYFVAIHLGAELPAFAGSLAVSLFAVAMVSRLRKGKTDPVAVRVSHTCETTAAPGKVLFELALFICLFLCLS